MGSDAPQAVLTRFEVARLVGLRSLQLSEGAQPLVTVEDARLRQDPMYVAALELRAGRVAARVRRRDGAVLDVARAEMPRCLDVLLDTRDGGSRSLGVGSRLTR